MMTKMSEKLIKDVIYKQIGTCNITVIDDNMCCIHTDVCQVRTLKISHDLLFKS